MGRRTDFSLGLLVPRRMDFADIGKPVMGLLHDHMPDYRPYRYDTSEPLNEVMEEFDVQRLEDPWKRGFFWKGRRGVSEGSVWPDSVPNHSALYLTGKSIPMLLPRAVQFLLQASQVVRPDFAYLHLLTETEFRSRDYHMCHPYSIGIVTQELRKYLPDLEWGMVFGPPYVRMFGRQTLLSAPVFIAHEIGEETIYVQLTDSLRDLQTDYDRVDQVREATKDHLGRDAFLDTTYGLTQIYNSPPAGRYRTPDFVISP